MNKLTILVLLLTFSFSFTNSSSTDPQNYEKGEMLKYRIHYGLLNAGFATLTVNEENYNGEKHFHIIGEGSSSGAVRAFYKVDDRYETYINKSNNLPSKFVRNISEGGYTRDQEFFFNHNNKTVKIHDKKNQSVKFKSYNSEVQDLLSAFYYFRNKNTNDLKTGDFTGVNIFIDNEEYKFKIKVLGKETIKSKFGEIACLKIRPYVQSGRIFKESESVTMWVTDDKNHIPIRIKAELVVGSLKADIHDYKNNKYSLDFKN